MENQRQEILSKDPSGWCVQVTTAVSVEGTGFPVSEESEETLALDNDLASTTNLLKHEHVSSPMLAHASQQLFSNISTPQTV